MTPIYIKHSYVFDVTITVNEIPVDLSLDRVVAYLSLELGKNSYSLSKDADVSTYGLNGVAVFEFTQFDTQNLNPGNYFFQIVWESTYNSRKYVVVDTMVQVKKVVYGVVGT